MNRGQDYRDLPPTGPPYIIGWKERLDFPEWGIRRVKVKIDTGARTSAIHVADHEIVGGKSATVRLWLSLNRRRPDRLTVVQTPLLRTVVVRNSGGQEESRPVIAAMIRLGPVTKQVLLTVTNRASMLFRMLLGRKALEGDFLVDVSKRYHMR